jgi:integral membrane sensor domain MASE1
LIGRTVRLNALNEFLIFLGVAAAGVPLLSALAAGRRARGDPLWIAMYQRFLGDALAQVIATPTILYWCTREYRQSNARVHELFILSICRVDGVVLRVRRRP